MTITPYSYVEIKKSNFVCQSLTELAISIELYRRSRGTYPATLSDLVGDYITAIPQDPFSTGPISKDSFRYERTVDGYVVYSVGRDGIDNYGTGNSDLDEFGPTDIRIRVGEVVK